MNDEKLVVLVPTFRRPDLLAAALDSLARQSDPHFEILVSDNDGENRSGALAVEQWIVRDQRPVRATAIICADRGLSHNRNFGLAHAFTMLGANLVAMIDDDSEADPEWVARLKQAALSGADLIGGPTIYTFPDDVPEFIAKRDMFGVPHGTTGRVGSLRSANNLTIARRVFDELDGQVFDHAFSATGGEDSFLFAKAQRQGWQLWWQQDALVYEAVPRHRCSAEWVAQRHRISAINAARIDVMLDGIGRAAPRQVALSIKALASAAFHALKGSDRWVVREKLSGATGRIQGLLGVRHLHDSTAKAPEAGKPRRQ